MGRVLLVCLLASVASVSAAAAPSTGGSPADSTKGDRGERRPEPTALIHGPWGAIPRNPADRLLDRPIDPRVYDPATGCKNGSRPGIRAMTRWLDSQSVGRFWGSYRCERWGKKSASLHAENRAIDWALDYHDPRQRADGLRLIRMLLAPDKAGNPHALARRMGVQEIIFGCSYWGSWGGDFTRYSVCYKNGKKMKGYSKTAGHDDHLHVGFSKAGSTGRTSFWQWYKKNH